MRTLALVILTFNVTWGAAWSVLVLYAQDRLGMGEVGFGAGQLDEPVGVAVDSGGQVAVSGAGFSAVASVTLGNLSATYDGSPKSSTASTSPSGLPVAAS